ncbi:MAG TPA: helix-turn-helix transcriptional regulator [Bacilli bacterium]|nr:helix-turn-helix transcriptional regulator [Bacilli bacterium]
MSTPLSLGQKIRELRLQHGLTQSDLGSGLVTPSMISQIESDKAHPSHKLLVAIAEKLETSVEYFLTDVENQLEQQTTFSMARALVEAGRYAEAAELFESLTNSETHYVKTIIIKTELAFCLHKLGERDKAITLYENVLELALVDENTRIRTQTLNQLGHLHMEDRNFSLALYYWKKALELLEKSAEQDLFLKTQVLVNLGRVYHDLGELNQSLHHFQAAQGMLHEVEDFPSIARIYTDLAQESRTAGRFQQATDYAAQAVAVYKTLGNIKLLNEVKSNYGIMLGWQGETEESLDVLKKCADEYKKLGYVQDAAEVYGEVGRVLSQAQRFEEAASYCGQGIELVGEESVESAYLHRTLGDIRLRQGEADAAIRDLERSIALFEKYGLTVELSKSYALLGDLHKERGDFLKATECLQNMQNYLELNLKERGIVL